LNGRSTGSYQTEQPAVREVGIWPQLMITATTASTAMVATSENAPQPHSNPCILVAVEPWVGAMLEVREPAADGLVHVCNHALDAPTILPERLRPDRVPHLLNGLLAGPVFLSLEGVTQKVEGLDA